MHTTKRTSRLCLVVLFAVGAALSGCDELPADEAAQAGHDCESSGQWRECDDGIQFCDTIDGELRWGRCLDDVECLPGEEHACGFSQEELDGFGWDNDPVDVCTLSEGEPGWPSWGACDTPLVLVFDNDPIEFMSSAATFDISGIGECLSTDWPAARTPWLALDRDKSGVIEGGGELFGTGTVLGSGTHAHNGFAALGELDSNHDGQLDAKDERWDELVLWADHDADRRSAWSELRTIESLGVESIALDYTVRGECDDRGNCGVERAAFRFRGADQTLRMGEVVDVHLPCR